METKTCCRCQVNKPLSEFNLKPQAACKACINVYQAMYRERNRERLNEKARVRSRDNPNSRHVWMAKYREHNREKLNANQRAYAKTESRKAVERVMRAKYSAELVDAFVRRSIVKNTAIDPKDVPPEIITAKRLQLQILRTIKMSQTPEAKVCEKAGTVGQLDGLYEAADRIRKRGQQ